MKLRYLCAVILALTVVTSLAAVIPASAEEPMLYGIQCPVSGSGRHTYDTRVTKEPTCKDAGTKETYCTSCGEVFSTIEISTVAHTSVGVDEVSATCTSTGTTAGTKCSVCGTILSGCAEIPMEAHTSESQS